MVFVDVVAGQETVCDLVLRASENEVPVIGSFDAETKFRPVELAKSEYGDVIAEEAKPETSLLSVVGRGHYALAILEPGKEPTNHVLRDLAVAREKLEAWGRPEPTNHVLRDLAVAREKLEAWGRPIVLLCSDEKAMHRLQVEMSEGRYGILPETIVLGLDANGAVQKGIEQGMKVGPASDAGAPSRLPLVILADSFNRVFFLSEGYTIGLGEQLAATVAKL